MLTNFKDYLINKRRTKLLNSKRTTGSCEPLNIRNYAGSSLGKIQIVHNPEFSRNSSQPPQERKIGDDNKNTVTGITQQVHHSQNSQKNQILRTTQKSPVKITSKIKQRDFRLNFCENPQRKFKFTLKI